MKTTIFRIFLMVFMLLAASCNPGLPVVTQPPGSDPTPGSTATSPGVESALPTETAPEITATPGQIVLNPLTGLPVQDASLLDKRPVIVKVQNVPRESRPQWGLSQADHVYEYYIEYGDTRFAAVYYGIRPEQIGPVRSARHFDMQLIDMYQAVLLYGGAYEDLEQEMLSSEFGNRLIREGQNTSQVFYRYEPAGTNYLMANITRLDEVYDFYEIEDARPEFPEIAFSENPVSKGLPADVVRIRFSGSMYNRWDYDPLSQRYYRSSEVVSGMDEEYAPLYDRGSGEQIAADNLVVIFTRYNRVPDFNEVFDVPLEGSGTAYAMRDGQIFELVWIRDESGGMVTFSNKDGTPYSFKPGNTWFSILGLQSEVMQQERNWQFTLYMP